jgi:hypothetical protein
MWATLGVQAVAAAAAVCRLFQGASSVHSQQPATRRAVVSYGRKQSRQQQQQCTGALSQLGSVQYHTHAVA